MFTSHVFGCTSLFALILFARVRVSALRSRARFVSHELESCLMLSTYNIYIFYPCIFCFCAFTHVSFLWVCMIAGKIAGVLTVHARFVRYFESYLCCRWCSSNTFACTSQVKDPGSNPGRQLRLLNKYQWSIFEKTDQDNNRFFYTDRNNLKRKNIVGLYQEYTCCIYNEYTTSIRIVIWYR